MPAILRSILAVIAGFIVGAVVNMALIQLNSLLFPELARIDWNDRAAVAEAMANAPPSAFLLILLAHSGHAFVGAWLAVKIAGRAPLVHGMIIGVLVLLGGIAALRMIPPPAWFAPVDLVLYLPAAWLGTRLAWSGRRTDAMSAL
jgi:hypothetical protein